MRVLFMGTPEFAQVSLEKLISEKYDICGVFTQPDKPKGRGKEECSSPVKRLAAEYGIPVFQPAKLRDGTAYDIVASLNPDIIVVVAYGKKIPDSILNYPKYGCINVHGSLLPKYRGAAPIQWAVLNGDKVTGVTTMHLATEMDSGDIIYKEETEIGEFETSGQLFSRLAVIGADLLIRTLVDIENDKAPRIPQDHSQASYVTMLDKSLSPLEFNKSPREIVKQIYGLQPWPVATVCIEGNIYKVFSAKYTDKKTDARPGTIVYAGKEGIEFSCRDGNTVMITELQAPGGRRMSAADFLRGHKINTAE